MSLGPTGRMLCQPSAPQDTGIGLEAIETGPSCQRERPCRTAKGVRHLFSVSLAPSPRLRFPVFPVLPSSRSYVSMSPLLPSPSATLPGSRLFAEPSAGCDIDPLTAGKRHRSRFRNGGDPWSIRDLRATSSDPITAKSVLPISRSSRGNPHGLVNEGARPPPPSTRAVSLTRLFA